METNQLGLAAWANNVLLASAASKCGKWQRLLITITYFCIVLVPKLIWILNQLIMVDAVERPGIGQIIMLSQERAVYVVIKNHPFCHNRQTVLLWNYTILAPHKNYPHKCGHHHFSTNVQIIQESNRQATEICVCECTNLTITIRSIQQESSSITCSYYQTYLINCHHFGGWSEKHL